VLALAALPSAPRRGAAGVAAVLTLSDLAIAAAVVVMAVAAAVRMVRGIAADRDDRLLVGALAGVVAFAVLWATATPLPDAMWSYPFWIVLGAADARACGNVRRP
jgi:hypothetical protein